MQDDITRAQAAGDEVQHAPQKTPAEPPTDELGDDALENVAGGWLSGGNAGNELPPWVTPTLPE